MATSSLQRAKTAKNDEFYTQLKDIENELKHYKDQLKGKVIFCNCDDPFESNFFKYFAMKFKQLGLKKLITTCYDPSPVVDKELKLTQASLFDEDKIIKLPKSKTKFEKHFGKAYKIELENVEDLDKDGSTGLIDVRAMLEREKAKLDRREKSEILTYLKGDGDFRSDECVELLKQADIVVTNPPFSLFREYVAQLIKYDKKFLIIGSKNAITYKEIFKLIAKEKLWLGYGFNAGNAFFSVPNSDIDRFAKGVFDERTGLVKFRNCTWFTNLLVDKSANPIVPYIKYEDGVKRGLYPKYDNYDAIEVSKVAEIPEDYYGAMGVPITFLDRWVPSVARANREREREKERSMSCWESQTVQDGLANSRCTQSSTERKSSTESLSDEFRIIWTTDRGGDGMLERIKKPYTRYDAPVVNGRGLYKRIIIKRV